MMENLRSAANHVVLKIIFGLIILSFILTGVGGYVGMGDAGYAAKVNGEEISRFQFENALRMEQERLRDQLGDNFSLLAGNEGYMAQMRQQVLQQLIDEILLEQYTKALNLGISDDQIKAAILNEPLFHVEGKFSNEKYQSELLKRGMTGEYYAMVKRKKLISEQLIEGIAKSIFILPNEQNRVEALAAQERVIRELTFDIAQLEAGITPTDPELQAYYAEHSQQFVSPEQVKVSYIELDAAKIEDAVTVSEEDISAYYELNKSRYAQPERKKFSIILLKTQNDAQAVLDELKKGADFATLARERSIDTFTGKQGGAMDWMEPNAMLDEFKQANLTEKGQLSGVIKSDEGYFILRLDDLLAEQVKPLAEVHAEIADTVKREKSLDAYYALQQKVSTAAADDTESLAAAEAAAGIKAVHTDWFTQANVPDALNFKELIQMIFGGELFGASGAPGQNSTVINVEGDRAFVIRVDDHKPEATRPFAEVREQLVQAVKRQQAEAQARSEAEKLQAALQQGKGAEALTQAGMTFGEPKTVTRAEQQNPLVGAVFALPEPQKDKPEYGISTDLQGNVVLVELQQIHPGKMSDEQLQSLLAELRQSQTESTFESLLNSLRQEAKIKLGKLVEE